MVSDCKMSVLKAVLNYLVIRYLTEVYQGHLDMSKAGTPTQLFQDKTVLVITAYGV